MALIELIRGYENFSDCSSKISLFYRKSFSDDELALYNACKLKPSPVLPVGNKSISKRPASITGDMDRGCWYVGQYSIEEDHIIKVYCERRPGGLKHHVKSSFFIRMRDKAAYQRINIRLTESDESSIKVATIEGRFDIVPLKEAELSGLDIKPQFKGLYADTYFNSMCTVEQLQPEIEPRKSISVIKMVNEEGKEVNIPKFTKTRVLEL